MSVNSQRRDAESAIPPTDTPLLRTLLLTDLCDSTEIVERIGDAASAKLFREHDKLVLELQQRWRGRLIDRSDGLLLLFERPIDGLGFALDYMKALKPLGEANRIDLRARAGLHVGEVLTWRNSVEAVQQGAKPLEVEGLAKPMAARLMSLARPGQILLSPVAEPLVHRASRELGERGDNLLWKSHGRWKFKGVPAAQEIHEVGEAGTAPLRAPKSGPKAWRDVPFWRRPASLMAEAAVLALVAFGAWFFFKPEPAIAFAERDWVVMGDLRNLTGDPRLDESLEQAFRISLEQSRYVNVLSDLKARETLQRMQKPEGTALDRNTASEIALRDGARAVILPTVSEVGGRLRVSAEVVDPNTQATVYAETADGRGIGSALDSVDDVTGALREKLGEAMASIQRDSKPLPQVTTSNIDALKAYALGESAFSRGEFANAEGYYHRAIDLDKNFALAYVGVLKSLNARGRASEAMHYLEQALMRQESLTARDRAYLQGWQARMTAPHKELEAWAAMAELFPDDYRAIMNAGYLSFARSLYRQALDYSKRASTNKNRSQQRAVMMKGDSLMALGRFQEAAAAYKEARKLDDKNAVSSLLRVREANLRAASGSPALALSAVNNQRFDKDVVSAPFLVGIGVAAGNWSYAERQASEYQRAQEDTESLALANGLMIESLRWIRTRNKTMDPAFGKALRMSLAESEGGKNFSPANDQALIHMYAAILALRMGDRAIAGDIQRVYEAHAEAITDPEVELLWRTVQARQKLAAGHGGEAVVLLKRLMAENPPVQTRVALLDAYKAEGNMKGQLAEAKQLRKVVGQAYIEIGCGWCQQSLNIADSVTAWLDIAEASARLGEPAAAKVAIAEFDKQWPQSTLPSYLRSRREAVPTLSSIGW